MPAFLAAAIAILVAVAVVAVLASAQRSGEDASRSADPSGVSSSPSPSGLASTGCGTGLTAGGDTGNATSQASASAAGGPVPSGAPSDGDGASPSIPPDVEEQIVAVEQTVPITRGLEPTRAVAHRIVDPQQLGEELAQLFEMENPPERLAAEEALLERLGLLPPGTDLEAEVLDLLSAQVAAYYRPDTNEFVIVDRTGEFGPAERMTVAHEYTHALQDQNFELATIRVMQPGQTDRRLARTALIEGDATLLMFLWAQANLSLEELAGVQGQALDPDVQASLAEVPTILCRQLLFPYEQGLLFALDLYREGGWDAINEAYRDPPNTTEQILHPEKYASREQAVPVEVANLAPALGPGWRRPIDDTLGELFIQTWAELTRDQRAARATASGWGGDLIASYDGPGHAWAVTWDTRWDTPDDASQFADAANAILPILSARGVVQAPAGGQHVRLILANDDATLRHVADRFLASTAEP